MAFGGILEDRHLSHVPGTVILDEKVAHSGAVTAGLRHGTGRNTHVVLVPQPSEDPNDPLNWSPVKKLACIIILGLGTCLNAATIAPLLNAGLSTISKDFGVPIGQITLISGYQLLVAGGSGPFVSAFSRKFGKRPCFLFSSLFGLIGTIVGSATINYQGLLAARIIQGLAISAYESLIISVIGDLYFVHQRGRYASAIQFLLGGISNFSSIITGAVTANLGWKYLFHLLIAFLGFQIILLFLFCPETSYIRDNRYEIDELAVEDLKGLSEVEHRQQRQEKNPKEDTGVPLAQIETLAPTVRSIPEKKTFWQETAIFTGSYSDENLLQLVAAPFAVCMNIAVLWVVVISGTITATYVAQAYVLAQIFSLPPYGLNASGIGYLSLGPFIGGIVASIFLGVVYDRLIRWFCARNGGTYEPEYRLVVMAGGLLTGGGLCAWGYMIENAVNLYACATVHGIVLFGVICVTISSSAYALDAYRDMSNEIFIAGMVFKNFLFYGFSYFVNDWTATVGPAEVFYVFGGVAFALTLTTVPLYIFGKK
ncbi:putative MFS-type transporter [Lachnellula willkommii]|uniref:Putative MFS-type transporter n=1 Tax=Lachnellula willkommii TaxID=215461 RepID=A0A559MIN4_9HELO|nr:putative MFS-type transporter [Lachnellula willkommii]